MKYILCKRCGLNYILPYEEFCDECKKTLRLQNHTRTNNFEPKGAVYLNEKEQTKIYNFLKDHNIQYLIHFTDSKNIESIKKHGILSIKELKKNDIPFCANDPNRLDKKLDYISLSITAPNYYVLSAFKQRIYSRKMSIIYLDPSLLYREYQSKRIYCDRNAAASSCEKGSSFLSLVNMFKESSTYATTTNIFSYNRKTDMRKNNEPTDPQAEILFYNRIDPKYIIKIEEI